MQTSQSWTVGGKSSNDCKQMSEVQYCGEVILACTVLSSLLPQPWTRQIPSQFRLPETKHVEWCYYNFIILLPGSVLHSFWVQVLYYYLSAQKRQIFISDLYASSQRYLRKIWVWFLSKNWTLAISAHLRPHLVKGRTALTEQYSENSVQSHLAHSGLHRTSGKAPPHNVLSKDPAAQSLVSAPSPTNSLLFLCLKSITAHPRRRRASLSRTVPCSFPI